MNELKSCLIGDVAEIIGGGTPSTKNEENFGGDIAWITPKDLSDHDAMYISKGERSITTIGLENSSAKLLPANSILFTSRAPIGYVALAKNEITTNQGFKSLVLKDDNDPKFFYYLLKNITPQIKSYASGSTFQEISGKVLSTITIKIPDPNIQKRIGEFIEKFDKKIELNKKNNETLEYIAKAVFKSWFVDFDPVRAKAEDRSTGLPDDISNLFPDSFVETELGKIPKNWNVVDLQEIAEFQNGYAFKSKEYIEKSESSLEVFRMGYILRGGGFKEDNSPVFASTSSKGYQKKYALEKKDLTIAMTDMKDKMAILGCCALIEESNRFLLNQRVGRIRVKDCKIIDSEYLYLYMNYPKNIDQIRSKSNSGVQVNLSTDVIKNTQILIPEISLMEKFSEISNDLFSTIFKNNITTKTLVEMRNILLPKLISGELRIPDAEKMIEEAGI